MIDFELFQGFDYRWMDRQKQALVIVESLMRLKTNSNFSSLFEAQRILSLPYKLLQKSVGSPLYVIFYSLILVLIPLQKQQTALQNLNENVVCELFRKNKLYHSSMSLQIESQPCLHVCNKVFVNLIYVRLNPKS